MHSAKNSALARILMRARGERSADPRDVTKRLQKARQRAARAAERTQALSVPVQLWGEQLDRKQFSQWRNERLRTVGGFVPEWEQRSGIAIVLHAVPYEQAARFLRRGSYTESRHLGAPMVGFYKETVSAEVALGATVAGLLEGRAEAGMHLAPPILRTYTGPAHTARDRVISFDLEWERPAPPLEPQPS